VGSGVKLDVPSFSSVGETQHNSVLAILTYENYQKKKKRRKKCCKKDPFVLPKNERIWGSYIRISVQFACCVSCDVCCGYC